MQPDEELKGLLDRAETPKVGIHPGMDRDAYDRWDAINQSYLKGYLRSPAHARQYALDGGKSPTKAMVLGQAGHTSVLEPDLFGERFTCGPDGDWRTKKARAALDELRDAHPYADILKPAEHAAAIRMGGTVRAMHSKAAVLLDGKGTNEVAVVVEIDGVLCKMLLDRITSYEGWPAVVDLKFTQDARPHKFFRQATNLRYHMQSAFYHDGISIVKPAEWRYFIVAIEQEAPHATNVFEVLSQEMDIGRDDYKRAMKSHVRCLETGEYPAYGDDIEPLRLSDWAYEVDE